MAIIPVYQQDQQLSGETKNPNQSIAQASDQSLAGPLNEFGTGLANFELARMRAERERKINVDNDAVQLIKQAGVEESIRIKDSVYLNAPANGVGWLDMYENGGKTQKGEAFPGWKKTTEALLKGVTDEDVKKRATHELMEVGNRFREEIVGSGFKAHQQYTNLSVEQRFNKTRARVEQNPEMYDTYFKDFVQDVDGTAATPSEKIAAIAAGEKELAQTAIRSYTDRREFDKAKFVAKQKFSKLFNEKEQSEILTKISVAADAQDKKEMYEIEKNLKLIDMSLKREQTHAQEDIGKQITEFMDMEPGPEKFQSSAAMLTSIEEFRNERRISDDDANRWKSIIKDEVSEDQHPFKNKIYDQIAASTNRRELGLAGIAADKAFDEKLISGPSHLELKKIIEAQGNKMDADARRKGPKSERDKINDALFNKHLATIKAMEADPLNIQNQLERVKSQERLSQATSEMYARKLRGEHPDKILQAVAGKYYRASFEKSIPYISQENQITIHDIHTLSMEELMLKKDAAVLEVETQVQLGTRTKKEAAAALLEIEKKIKARDLLVRPDTGVKPKKKGAK